MDKFLERLLDEETTLNERKAKLEKFMTTNTFNDLTREQRGLLKIQLNAMCTYSECLNQRIIQINSTEPHISN